jgi:uncharacterized membrane protein YeaQ/YmgE (transglycosylase-associated protein family)
MCGDALIALVPGRPKAYHPRAITLQVSIRCPAGVPVKGGATVLHAIWWVITGFVVGLIARAILPGADSMGFILTSALGIGGSLVGGAIGHVIWKPPEGSKFHPAGFLLSLIGAVILLFAWRAIR